MEPEQPTPEQVARDPQRPRYHFLPPRFWMNDPNGLIQYRGEYHLFYQHNPKAAVWGNMTWGHATSRDLVHWRHLPLALHPDHPYDRDGVFSGCMVDDGGTPTAIYTGTQPEVQCIATSRDMLTWSKPVRNPVIAAPPPGLAVTGFRDPYVWKEGDTWSMVVGSGVRGRGGAILLYRSKDLVEWEYLHPAAEGDGTTGTMWECPNLFPLGDRWVLLLSPIPLGRSIYLVGRYQDGRFTPEGQGELDPGGSYYAPQAFADERGRRIAFGWLRENRPPEAQVGAGWSGVMSLPRVLTLQPDGGLGFAPAPELAALRGPGRRQRDVSVDPGAPTPLPDVRGDQLEILATFAPGEATEFGLRLRRSPDGSEETVVTCDRRQSRLTIDRSRASAEPGPARDRLTAPLTLAPEQPATLHLFLDHSVLEVYANGRSCLTARIYPTRPDSLGVDLVARGGKVTARSVEAWELASIWDRAR
jgi:beta-fructofuranosidase